MFWQLPEPGKNVITLIVFFCFFFIWEHWLTHQYIFHTLPEGISFAGRSSRYDNSRISSQCHSFALPMVLLGVWRKRNLYKRMLFVWKFHSIWRPCHLIRHYSVQNLYVINAKWVRLLLFIQVHSWVCHEADALRGAQGVVVHQLREGTFCTLGTRAGWSSHLRSQIFIRAPQNNTTRCNHIVIWFGFSNFQTQI